jgi:hypothetical protein
MIRLLSIPNERHGAPNHEPDNASLVVDDDTTKQSLRKRGQRNRPISSCHIDEKADAWLGQRECCQSLGVGNQR